MKYKQLFSDVLLNTISNFFLIALIQLIIFPIFNNLFPEKIFGEIIAIYGINSMILVFLGDSLNNAKILHQNEDGLTFNMLAILSCIISFFIAILIFDLYVDNLKKVDLFVFSLATALGVLRLYLGSTFRIKLNYKILLISNLQVFIGYLIGLLLCKIFNFYLWSLIFLIGEFLGVIYLLNKTSFFSQPFVFGHNKNKVLKDYFNLSFTYGINSISTYLDRLLIIPLLGATSMSVFYAASTSSKILTMLVGQVSTVLLSYIMRSSRKLNRKNLFEIIVLLVLVCILAYFPFYYFSKFLVKILYPNLYLESLVFIPFIIIAIIFYSICNILKLIILKYYSTSIQMFFQLFITSLYIIMSYYLSVKKGLLGFTLSYMIAAIVYFLLYIILLIYIRPEEKND